MDGGDCITCGADAVGNYSTVTFRLFVKFKHAACVLLRTFRYVPTVYSLSFCLCVCKCECEQ